MTNEQRESVIRLGAEPADCVYTCMHSTEHGPKCTAMAKWKVDCNLYNHLCEHFYCDQHVSEAIQGFLATRLAEI